jgi:hypothetical protein
MRKLLTGAIALFACSPAPADSTGTGDATQGSSSGSEPTTESPTTTTGGSSGSEGTGTTSGTSGETTGTSGEQSTGGTTTSSGSTSTGEATTGEETTGTTGMVEPNPLWDEPNLWYAVDDALIYMQIDPASGAVVKVVHNQLMADVPLWDGQNGLTMLEGGALLGSRESAEGTQIYYVAEPPITEDTPASAVFLGNIAPDQGQMPPRIEALYTDCDGRVYLMDTGVDVSNSSGNRLLRFTGDYLQGDLSYEVLTDLQKASVGDIDDMSPGIVDGEINDLLGFAIDSSELWQLDYTTGTGMNLAATSGTWGVHALGGPLFDDLQPRLYVLSQNATLFEIDLANFSSSDPLVVGPDLMHDNNGWSGLAGPLTECVTAIPG